MPKKAASEQKQPATRQSRGSASKIESGNSESGLSDDQFDDIQESPATNGVNLKRKPDAMEADVSAPADFDGEMNKLLERFGSDISKTMLAKRRRLEQYTQESMRSTTKKVLDTNKTQSTERKKLIDDFRQRFCSLIEQGESELEKTKEAEDKLQKLINQQQKHQQQMRIAQGQRLKSLNILSEQFFKGMNELDESHIEQYSSVHNELRKEMALLQKKILVDTQQQEMMNVRKSLRSMLM